MNNIYISRTIAKESKEYFLKNEHMLKGLKLNHLFENGNIKLEVIDFQHENVLSFFKSYIDTFVAFDYLGNDEYLLNISTFHQKKDDVLTHLGSIHLMVSGFDSRKVKNRKLTNIKGHKQARIVGKMKYLNIVADIAINMLYYIDIKTKDSDVKTRTITNVNRIEEGNSKQKTKDNGKPSVNYIDLEKVIRYVNTGCTNVKEFNRKTESWGVRGHHRKIRDKNGKIIKTIFIKPYVKGNRDVELKDKNYVLISQ